jgi:hypothetical protein
LGRFVPANIYHVRADETTADSGSGSATMRIANCVVTKNNTAFLHTVKRRWDSLGDCDEPWRQFISGNTTDASPGSRVILK